MLYCLSLSLPLLMNDDDILYLYCHSVRKRGACGWLSEWEWMEIVYNNNSSGSRNNNSDDIRIQNVLLFINIHFTMTFLYPVTKSNMMIKIQFAMPLTILIITIKWSCCWFFMWRTKRNSNLFKSDLSFLKTFPN